MSWESALDVANGVRFARATIKRELRDHTDKHASLRMCGQHIADPVAELEEMSAFDLVAACHRCGPAVALKVLNQVGVSANVKIGHPDRCGPGLLSARQRKDLIAALNVGPVVRGPARQPRPIPAPVLVVEPVAVVEPDPEPVLIPQPAEPGPSLAKWCSNPKCGQWTLPMRNGTCGFCDTLIVEAA